MCEPCRPEPPITTTGAESLWQQAQEAAAQRAAEMPDEATALTTLNRAYQRLKELGWREAIYSPKANDAAPFLVIEPGCSTPQECTCLGDWPTGSWFVSDGDDLWPSHPILFKLRPDDEARRQEMLDRARDQYQAEEKKPDGANVG